MATPSTRVPTALQEKFSAISQATDAFCDLRLNDEYKQMIRLAAAVLSRKRPSPLGKGTEAAWAAGLVHAVGMVNFLFDATQTPHCKATDIRPISAWAPAPVPAGPKKHATRWTWGSWHPRGLSPAGWTGTRWSGCSKSTG